jgi:hypothetical protein
MRAVLRRLHSPDIYDLATFTPRKPDNFGLLLQILVGPENGAGEESFDVFVCTPRWLLENHRDEDIVMGRHTLIMFGYDSDRLQRMIRERVPEARGTSCQDVVVKLGRLGRWEFEDYCSTPPKPENNP